MLRIGKLTDYAMLIMSQLAQDSVHLLSANQLAESLNLPLPTVSKILKMLAEAKLVNSVRGAEGGYHLAKEAQKISVADIIFAMEGEMAITECCEKVSPCVITSMCAMRENWRKINNAVQAMLDNLTIMDMLKPLAVPAIFTRWGVLRGENRDSPL